MIFYVSLVFEISFILSSGSRLNKVLDFRNLIRNTGYVHIRSWASIWFYWMFRNYNITCNNAI